MLTKKCVNGYLGKIICGNSTTSAAAKLSFAYNPAGRDDPEAAEDAGSCRSTGEETSVLTPYIKTSLPALASRCKVMYPHLHTQYL